MAIDRHSETWKSTERWLKQRRAECVQSLINGSAKDERYRGEVRLIDDLLAHASEKPERDPATMPPADY